MSAIAHGFNYVYFLNWIKLNVVFWRAWQRYWLT